MAKITVQPDCGNSPRKLFLKNFGSAVANGDEQFLNDHLGEKTLFKSVGKKEIEGKEKILATLKKMPQWKVKSLTIETIITHGRNASDSGTFTDKNNVRFAYSNIYRFTGAGGFVLKSITSFIVKEKQE